MNNYKKPKILKEISKSYSLSHHKDPVSVRMNKEKKFKLTSSRIKQNDPSSYWNDTKPQSFTTELKLEAKISNLNVLSSNNSNGLINNENFFDENTLDKKNTFADEANMQSHYQDYYYYHQSNSNYYQTYPFEGYYYNHNQVNEPSFIASHENNLNDQRIDLNCNCNFYCSHQHLDYTNRYSVNESSEDSLVNNSNQIMASRFQHGKYCNEIELGPSSSGHYLDASNYENFNYSQAFQYHYRLQSTNNYN